MRSLTRSFVGGLGLVLVACSADVEPLVGATPDAGPGELDAGLAPHGLDAGLPVVFEAVELGDARAAQVLGFSPDGRYLAFVTELDGLRGVLRALDLTTRQVRTLDTHVITEVPTTGEALSPRSDGVLYRRTEAQGGFGPWIEASDLYFVRWDGAREKIGVDTHRNGFRFAGGGRQVLHHDGPDNTLGLYDLDAGRDRTLARGVDYARHAPVSRSMAVVDAGRAVAFTVRGDLQILDLATGASRLVSAVGRADPDRVRLDGDVLVVVVQVPLEAVLRRELSTGAQTLSPSGERALVGPDGTWALVVGLRDADRVQTLTLCDLVSGQSQVLDAAVSPDVLLGADGEALVMDGPIPAARRLSRVSRARGRLEELDPRVYGLGNFDVVARDVARVAYAQSGAALPEVGALVLHDLSSGASRVLAGGAGAVEHVLPGTATFVDGGRALLWREDAPDSPMHLYRVEDGTSMPLGSGLVVDLPGQAQALIERPMTVELVRWRDGAARSVYEGEARVAAVSGGFVVLSERRPADAWRLALRPL
jgi:hypothetical protein